MGGEVNLQLRLYEDRFPGQEEIACAYIRCSSVIVGVIFFFFFLARIKVLIVIAYMCIRDVCQAC